MAPFALFLFSALVGSSTVLATPGHDLKHHQVRQAAQLPGGFSDFETSRSILPIIDAGAPITFATTAAVPTTAQFTTTQAMTSAEVIATSTRREEESENTATLLLTTAQVTTTDSTPQVTNPVAPPPLVTTSTAAPIPDANTHTDAFASAGVSSHAAASVTISSSTAKVTSTPAANVPPAVLTGLLRTTATRAGLASTTRQSTAAVSSGAANAQAGGLEIPGAKTGAAGQKVQRGLSLALGAVVLGVVSMVV